MSKEVRVRIAPSPTGDPHVGTAYIALFNLAFAKHNGGKFLLRIEDTDQTRSTGESEVQIFDSLKWLGLNYDEGPDAGGDFGPYRQSERFGMYRKYAEELIEKDQAYYCFCTAERLAELREQQKANGENFGYDGHCKSLSKEEVKAKLEAGESHVIRLKVPAEGETVVADRLRGEIKFDNSQIDDQILLKSDGFPTYHLASVVDDKLMGITHVIRAEEWIASTPKHILLYRAFGWEEPMWVHMPLLRNADKTKISKRKNPVSLNFYKEEGYLKEGIVNFLGLMGYSMGDDQEIFTLEEMVNSFDFNKISLGGPVFDLVKLGWVNNQHMRMKNLAELVELAKPYYEAEGYITSELSAKEESSLTKVVEIMREGAATLKEMAKNSSIYYIDEFNLPVETEEMNKKQRKAVKRVYNSIENETGKSSIKLFVEKLQSLNEDVSIDEIKDVLNQVLEEIGEGPGQVWMPLRVVVTGQASGSDLALLISVIGKERTIKRIENTIKKYNI